jgi:hypothetical protein
MIPSSLKYENSGRNTRPNSITTLRRCVKIYSTRRNTRGAWAVVSFHRILAQADHLPRGPDSEKRLSVLAAKLSRIPAGNL